MFCNQGFKTITEVLNILESKLPPCKVGLGKVAETQKMYLAFISKTDDMEQMKCIRKHVYTLGMIDCCPEL